MDGCGGGSGDGCSVCEIKLSSEGRDGVGIISIESCLYKYIAQHNVR